MQILDKLQTEVRFRGQNVRYLKSRSFRFRITYRMGLAPLFTFGTFYVSGIPRIAIFACRRFPFALVRVRTCV